MAALVSKTSSQAFFLRILKVIVQIREAVRLANNKKTCMFDNLTFLLVTETSSLQTRLLNLFFNSQFSANQSSESSVDAGNTNQASESGNL